MQRIHKNFGFQFGFVRSSIRMLCVTMNLCTSYVKTASHWQLRNGVISVQVSCMAKIHVFRQFSNTHTRLCNSLFHAVHHKRAFTPYKIMYISTNLTACLEMCKGLSYTYPYSRSEKEILYSLSKFYNTVNLVRCVRIDRFSISFSQAYITQPSF